MDWRLDTPAVQSRCARRSRVHELHAERRRISIRLQPTLLPSRAEGVPIVVPSPLRCSLSVESYWQWYALHTRLQLSLRHSPIYRGMYDPLRVQGQVSTE